MRVTCVKLDTTTATATTTTATATATTTATSATAAAGASTTATTITTITTTSEPLSCFKITLSSPVAAQHSNLSTLSAILLHHRHFR